MTADEAAARLPRRASAPITGVALLGAALLFATALAAVSFGEQPVSLVRAFSEPDSLDALILFSARLPRVLLAAVAGAALGMVGASTQALLRNPLADPYVLGISGGAAAGATVAIVLGAVTVGVIGAAIVPVAALVGGLAATALVYAIARASGRVSGTAILLAGVIVNAVASAFITLIKTMVSASKSQELLFWLMGFIEVPSALELAVATAWVAVGASLLMAESGRMNLLALGREPAAHLGVDVARVERRVFFAASCVVGAVVSLTGLIGFVGLVVPHAVRRIVGPDHRRVLPAACLLGAVTLLGCDLVARAAFQWLGTAPPVGAVTALIGGPVFLVLLHRTRHRAAEA